MYMFESIDRETIVKRRLNVLFLSAVLVLITWTETIPHSEYYVLVISSYLSGRDLLTLFRMVRSKKVAFAETYNYRPTIDDVVISIIAIISVALSVTAFHGILPAILLSAVMLTASLLLAACRRSLKGM